MVNVSAAELCAKVNDGWPACSAKSRNTSSAMIARFRARANFVQFFQAPGLGEMPGGIIGMDNDHSPRARRDTLLQSVEIDLPAVIVDQRIANELYVLNIGQESEQRVARLGDKDFVARVAEGAEDESVGLAGASSENDVVSRNCRASSSVVCANCLTGDEQSSRIWVVRRLAGLARACRMARLSYSNPHSVGFEIVRSIKGFPSARCWARASLSGLAFNSNWCARQTLRPCPPV